MGSCGVGSVGGAGESGAGKEVTEWAVMEMKSNSRLLARVFAQIISPGSSPASRFTC